MNSLILRTVATYFVPVQILFSLFLLLRGHNDPGGGFAGGLVFVIAIALHAVAFSPEQTRKLLKVRPVSLIGVGLMTALAGGAIGLLVGDPFLTGEWLGTSFLGFKFGSPLLF